MLVEQRGDAGHQTFLVRTIDEQYGGFFHALLSLIHHLLWGQRPSAPQTRAGVRLPA
jgi:hypothetical protein